MKSCIECTKSKPLTSFNREAARPDGLQRYCRECQQERARHWREQNREDDLKRKRGWYRANPKRSQQTTMVWKQQHPDQNRAIDRQCGMRKRARKKGQFKEEVVREHLLWLHYGLCGVCGVPVDPHNFHVEHEVPLACGGEHSYANTRPAHPTCNGLKRKWDGSLRRSD